MNDARQNRTGLIAVRPEDGFVAGGNFPERFPIMTDRLDGVITDRSDTFLLPFSAHADEAFGSVEVFDPQTAKFADAEPAGINRFQNGGIAEVNGAINVCVFFFGRFALLGEFEDRRVEQRVHLVRSQKARKAPFEFGKLNVFDGNGWDGAAPHEKFVERAQGGEAEAHRGAGELFASEVTEIGAEIIALERGPGGGGGALGLMPAGEFLECLAVIALCIWAGGTIGGEVREERNRVSIELRRSVRFG